MLSTALISHEDKPDTDYTLLLMQWGQFLDHDITHTPINKGIAFPFFNMCQKEKTFFILYSLYWRGGRE